MDTARTKRLVLVELLIFLTLAGTTALLFRPLLALINRNIYALRDGVVARGEEVLRRPIRYGSLSPSLAGSLEIRDITIGEEPDSLAAADRVYLEYSFWGLLRGRGIGAIRRLIVEGPEISYDFDRDRDLQTLLGRKKDKDQKDFTLPPECEFQIREGSFRLRKGGIPVLGAGGVFFGGSIHEGRIALEGRWNRLEASGEIPPALSGEGSITGEFPGDLSGGGLSLRIDSLDGPGFSLGKNSFDLLFSEEKITLERAGDGLPLELSALYIPGGDLSLSFSADRLVMGRMVSFYGPLKPLASMMDLRLSGTAVSLFRRTPGRMVPEYSFKLEAGEGKASVRGFVLEGKGDSEGVGFSRCRLDVQQGSAHYEGDLHYRTLSPEGSLVFRGFSLTGNGVLNGTFSFLRNEEGFSIRSPLFTAGSAAVSGLAGGLARRDGGIAAALEFNPGPGRFFVKSFFDSGTGRLEGNAGMADVSAGDILRMASPFAGPAGGAGGWAEKTAFSAELSFATDFRGLSYNIPQFRAVYGDSAVLSAAFSGTERHVETREGRLAWRQGSAGLGVKADIAPSGDVSFLFDLSYLDFDYAFEGLIQDRRNFTLRDSQGLTVTMNAQDRGGWAGYVSAGGFPIPYRGRRAYLGLESALGYYNRRAWNLDINLLEIMDVGDRSLPVVNIAMQGQASQNGLNLNRIYYSDRYGRLEGSAAAIWNEDFSMVDGSLVLAGEGETERAAADIFYDGTSLEFHGTAVEFQADRIAESGKNLLVSGEFFGIWDGGDYYSVNITLDSLRGWHGDIPFSLSAMALLYPEQLTASRIYGSFGDMEGTAPYLSLNCATGSLETEIQLNGRVKRQDLGLAGFLRVNFSPAESWLELGNSAGAFSGALEIPYAYMDNRETRDPFAFTFSFIRGNNANPGVFRLDGGPLQFQEEAVLLDSGAASGKPVTDSMIRLEIRENSPSAPETEEPGIPDSLGRRGFSPGIFTAALSAPLPVQGTLTGIIDGTYIDALASDVYIDLAGLWGIIPIEKTVVFTGGFITGETRLYGSIFDPEFAGSAWGSGVSLIVPDYVAAEIGPGSGPVTLEGSGFSFGPVAAPCGDGGGEITGWFRFNRWLASFNLEITAPRPVPFDFNIAGVKAKGNAAGWLNLFMENSEIITITGDLNASDTEINLDAGEIERARENQGRTTTMDVITDIHVSAGRRVEFIWPSRDMPIIQAYGEAGSGIRIAGDTRIPQFTLDGDIVLRGGELYYLQRSFYIREGQIFFNGNDTEIDPRISARAEIRDRNDDGPVTIAMIIDNSPLRSFVPRFESNPSLSQLEIYSLLGQAPSAAAAAAADPNNPFLSSLTDVLIQSIVFRRVERQVKSILGLDMFSFRTQILQNAFFDAVSSQENQSGAGNYLDNTSIFIGKSLGPNLFFQTMLSFRYDQYRQEYGGMRLEPDIGLDLRTPLFDVRWNVSPRHPENLFVDDLSISLIWRWSL